MADESTQHRSKIQRVVPCLQPSGYLPIIPAKETFIMPLAANALPNLQYELAFTYESLSGRHYESKIRMDNLVLTGFRFRRLGWILQ
jgi:hypothetical protein